MTERQPGSDWRAFVRKNGTPEFMAAFSSAVVLETSVMDAPCVGIDLVSAFFAATTTMYDHLDFTYETDGGGKTIFEWQGKALGAEIAGTTIVTRNDDGLIESIRLYHRPYRAVIRFSAELAKRLAGLQSLRNDTHVTAPTRFIDVNGVRYAYRHFGSNEGTPLVFLPHYRAGMDHWDPAVTDGFGASRPVILFDNAGVAGSSGETPDTMEAMADNTAKFVGALGFSTVDVVGHSIGGYIAQTLALRHPETVRRLILAGTGPRGGEPSTDPKVREWGDSTDPQTGESSLDAFLYLFFRPSPASQAAGKAFWERRHLRKEDADRASTPQTMRAQRAAIVAWNKASGERYAELDNIKQPTLVVNGNHDIMVPTINSFTLSQRIPQAQLIIYPDSGHGALFQFPELFVAHGTLFLDGPVGL
jgi:pimeloyl-ACP methyl ester carboxylesterase